MFQGGGPVLPPLKHTKYKSDNPPDLRKMAEIDAENIAPYISKDEMSPNVICMDDARWAWIVGGHVPCQGRSRWA